MNDAQKGYQGVAAAGAASLAPDEFWCIHHPDGPLPQTASKDLTAPVRLICNALKLDWDVLTEQGFRLGKITMRKHQIIDANETTHLADSNSCRVHVSAGPIREGKFSDI
jgi:hypothetical protein